MTPEWRIVAHAGRDGLLGLRDDWMRLLAAMPERSFQHAFETHLAYAEHLPSPRGPTTCLALSDGERVRAIWPIEPAAQRILRVETRAWGLPAGLGNVARDAIVPPDEAVRRELLPRVVSHLSETRGGPSWLVLENILETSAAWQCLASLDRRRYCTEVVSDCAFVDCDRSAEDLAASLSKNVRAALRRRHNKLAALGDVRFEHVSDPAQLPEAFETFVKVEASGWKGEAGTHSALAQRPKPLAFYRAYVAALRESGRCEVNLLHAEGRCIAASLNVRVGAEYAGLKMAYDEEYAQLSPGRLLLERVLQRCCADPGIRRYNNVTHPAWIDDWRPTVVPIHTAYIAVRGGVTPLLLRLLRLRLRLAR